MSAEPLSNPTPPQPNDLEHHHMPLVEHLRELRYRLLVSIAAVGVGTAGSLLFANSIIELLAAPVRTMLDLEHTHRPADQLYAWLSSPLQALPGWQYLTEHQVHGAIVQLGSLEGIQAYFRVGLQAGVVLAAPVVAYQVWQFVAPGLYQTERTIVMPLTLASVGLFGAGALFAYLVIVPVSFQFFLTILTVNQVMLSYSDVISAVARIVVAFGVCFQLPVGVWFLARLGVVDHLDLLRGFRYAVIAIFLVAAMLTPPDWVSQLMLGVPLTALYGVGVVVAYVSTTKTR